MPVDVMDLVGHKVVDSKLIDIYDELYIISLMLDNGIAIEYIEFPRCAGESVSDFAKWVVHNAKKVLTASQSPRDSAFTFVFGKGEDGTCFEVYVLPEMIRRC